MPKYKIFVEETVKLKHLITVECDEDIIEYIPDPDDYAGGEVSDYAYNMLDDIDGKCIRRQKGEPMDDSGRRNSR